MIEASRILRIWLEANNIDPRKVELTLSADPETAHSLGKAIGRMHDAIVFGPPEATGPIREGEFHDIRFRVADGGQAREK